MLVVKNLIASLLSHIPPPVATMIFLFSEIDFKYWHASFSALKNESLPSSLYISLGDFPVNS